PRGISAWASVSLQPSRDCSKAGGIQAATRRSSSRNRATFSGIGSSDCALYSRSFAVRSPLITAQRTWARRCAPLGVQRICCRLHPLVQNLVDRGFSHRRRNGLTGTVEFPVVDCRAAVVLKVVEELAQSIVQLLEAVLEFRRLGDNDATEHQHLPHPILCFLEVRVPEAPPQPAQQP